MGHPTLEGRRVLGIGISVPGTVDPASGTLIDSTPLQASDLALGPLLEDRFALP
ncbi:MAG TPA: hypothetical protein VFT66_06535 [Roseiflexaceae bacterium]|nr:hypothetical protein [Roseiflexaceae bacterium]